VSIFGNKIAIGSNRGLPVMNNLVPIEVIESKIYMVRGRKIMLDRDLAKLYGVKTKVLNQAVKRNKARFPEDFMFQLTKEEAEEILLFSSRSQLVTLKRGQNIKYLPYAFTEQGVAMLSSVLNSERAIQVNIQIMRTFAKLRQILATHEELRRKIEDMERKYDQRFKVIFDAIKALVRPPEEKKLKIGFLAEKETHETKVKNL
jgi:phage regulator Rha-like protein